MSIWTSKPGLLALLIVVLAGCRLDPAALLRPRNTEVQTEAPPASRAVAGGAVIVAGPKGFCIDRSASRDTARQDSLTVLSACQGLGAGPLAPAPRHPAVLTATVAPEQPRGLELPDAAALQALLRSDTGRGALSRSGKPETVRILDSFAENDAVLVHLSDSAPFGWGAVQADYWRALLALGGRMVTVSVLAPPDAPLNREDGLQLLRDFILATRAATANPGKAKT